MRPTWAVVVMLLGPASFAGAQTSPLWHEEKIKNYLPHMTSPEVQDLLTRTDMAILPVPSLEQHGLHGPIGTDFYNGLQRALLVAQRTDVLVAPILFPGNSPYHMEFPGTITLTADTIQRVYFEAVQSLLRHGFHRILIFNSHGGNENISSYIVDRVNQETSGVAVELNEAAAPYLKEPTGLRRRSPVLDRHGGVGETSLSLYLTPNLVNMSAAARATITMPDHLQKMLPQVVAGDPTALTLFRAEGLKAEETGKHTSAKEMSTTGAWSVREPKEATAEQGRREAEAFVNAAVQFIEKWKQLVPRK
jgi:creatinine amidohydrolase